MGWNARIDVRPLEPHSACPRNQFRRLSMCCSQFKKTQYCNTALLTFLNLPVLSLIGIAYIIRVRPPHALRRSIYFGYKVMPASGIDASSLAFPALKRCASVWH